MKTNIITTAIIALSAIIALNWGTHPQFDNGREDNFSANRVAEDIKNISQHPHSITDNKERAEVRNYLHKRLEGFGGNVQIFRYDSLQGAGFTFDAYNIYAEFPPVDKTGEESYLMMIAHYDSRYRWVLTGETEVSHGAADDGYGIGVILETVRLASAYRDKWQQGIKVLFTDGEEVGMIGMKAAYSRNPEIFDNVGLTINVESRGTYGPALLFETSPKNNRLMQLYGSHARFPYTYSLTNVVYKYMPNSTDFAIIMDSIPGLNFATVADINHYHTSLDRYENISPQTILHYGRQITPIVEHYLTDTRYKEEKYLCRNEDNISFTIPILGMLSFSKNGYILLNAIITLLFIMLLVKEARKPAFTAKRLLTTLVTILAGATLATAIGMLTTWLCTKATGVKFSLFGITAGIPYDNKAMLICLLVIATTTIALCTKWMRTDTLHRPGLLLHSTLLLQGISGIALLATLGENMIFFVPFAATTAATLLWNMKKWSIFPWMAIAVISLHAFSFIYIVAMALTIGALSAIALLTFLYCINIAVLAVMACNRKSPIKTTGQ